MSDTGQKVTLTPRRTQPNPPPPAAGRDPAPVGGTVPDTWTTIHDLTVHAQIKTRPGPVDSNGDRWAENAYTGLVIALCNCGYTSGWVPRADLPTGLRSEHPAYKLPAMVPLIETGSDDQSDPAN